METQEVVEGELTLEVPKLENYQTSPNEYVPAKTPVFFNPVMRLTRDISISSVQVINEDIGSLRICDLLSGVGARGLRYAKELSDVGKVFLVDESTEAVRLIRRNIGLNEIVPVEVRNMRANSFLHDYRPRFHVIDIDPFGSPVPFLESSFSAISRRGELLVTATDTAPLCGSPPNACIRKYGAKSLRTPYCRELGLRIFMGTIQRKAASFDLSLSPLLSFADRHYFRAHFRVDQGAKKADRLLKKLGFVSHCFDCGRRSINHGLFGALPGTCDCGRKFEHAGPLWLGELASKRHLDDVVSDLGKREFESGGEEINLLNVVREESEGPPSFYDAHEISSIVGKSPPKLKYILRGLREEGYFASPTHFSSTGIRTEASLKDLIDIIS